MKELLAAVKADLQAAASLSFIGSDDIFITPHEDIIPVGCSFPALGLKDGSEQYQPETSKKWQVKRQVNIIIYVELADGEVPVMGQEDSKVEGKINSYGVLDLEPLIHAELANNMLDLPGMESAWPVASAESETVAFDKGGLVVQKKLITYEYQLTEVRP